MSTKRATVMARATMLTVICVAAPVAMGAFDSNDLAGTWWMHHLNSGDYPAWTGWSYFQMNIDASGQFVPVPGTYLNSDGDSGTPASGTVSITADGILSVSKDPNSHGVLDWDKDFAVVTMGDNGGYNLSVLQKHSDTTFGTNDIAGQWRMHGVISGDSPQLTSWVYGTMDANDDGSFSYSVYDVEGPGVTTGSGTAGLAADGVFTIQEIPSAHGVMSDDKETVIMTTTDGGGGYSLYVLQKHSDVTFTTGDLAGTWYVHGLTTGDAPQWTGYFYGTMEIAASGVFSGSVVASDGDTSSVNDTASITSDGIITFAGVPSAHGAMSDDRTLIALTMNDGGGGYNLLVLTRALAPVLLSDYMPITPQEHGIKTFTWTHGATGEYSSKLAGFETVPYASGPIVGVHITNHSDWGTILVSNDGTSVKFLGTEDSYVSTDTSLTNHPVAYSFGALYDGMLIDQGTHYWVQKDLSAWERVDNQVLLISVQAVNVPAGNHDDAVVIWYLDTDFGFSPLTFHGRDSSLGLTLPTSSETGAAGVTAFEVYARTTGLIAQGDIDAGTGSLNNLAELVQVQDVPLYTVGGAVYTDPNDPLGSGLAGVSVTVTGPGGTFEAGTGGGQGLWQIADVPEASYTVTPRKTGYVLQHASGGSPDGRSSILIDVNEGNQEAIQGIQFLAEVAVLSDDFDDGIVGSMWEEHLDDPNNCWTEEINGRLEIRATGDSYEKGAFYRSLGWALDPYEDFSLRVAYHYDLITSEGGGVSVALVPSASDPAVHRVVLRASCDEDQAYAHFSYEVSDDAYWLYDWTPRDSNDGTLYVSYSSVDDELYLSYTGFGSTDAWQTVSGLLRGRWQGEPLHVGLGGGSENLRIASGDAYLDDFVIIRGHIVYPYLRHDWNQDGIISIVGDVPPFVNCVYFSDCPDSLDTIGVGDCSGDGILSIVGDVPCFVDCVYFGNCSK